MAGPPTAAFVQINARFAGLGLPLGAEVTFGYAAGVLSEANLLDIADAYGDLNQNVSTSACVLTDILVKRGPSNTGSTTVVPVNRPGARAGSTLTSNTALLVRKVLADVSGRRWGRFYWPGVSENDVGGAGDILPASHGVLQGAFTAWFNSLDTLGLEPVVFSTTGSDPKPVESLQLQTVAATQRRRMRR